jgi:hypothetical protein
VADQSPGDGAFGVATAPGSLSSRCVSCTDPTTWQAKKW